MNTVTLKHIVPKVFANTDLSKSDLWAKDFTFTKKSTYLIAANSGTGKSSLFDFIIQRRCDYTGELLFDEKPSSSLSVAQQQQLRRNHLSIVPQGLQLFSELTAWENVQLKNRLTNHKADEEVEYFFHLLGLTAKRNEQVRTLSFGQQQRVAIIRALCQPFDFLLLDEPFSHLDEANVTHAFSLILKELEAQNAGLLLASLGSGYGQQYTKTVRL